MSIQGWLGETAKTEFAEQYYQKLPYSGSGAAGENRPLASWEDFGALLSALAQDQVAIASAKAGWVAAADVMVVRQGQRLSGAAPKDLQQAKRLLGEGATILVRHAERLTKELGELAAGFARDFAAPVNIHVYATAGGQFGFGWHYDAEDVFLLQTIGAKEYSLRKNTVHPWPLEETIPADMGYPREIMPLLKCRISAGDWLYVPCGYWHKAEAKEDSLTLAVGVMAPSAMSVYDALRRRLVESLVWRQRLPTTGEASPLDQEGLKERYRDVFKQLARDFVYELEREEFLDWFLDEKQKNEGQKNN